MKLKKDGTPKSSGGSRKNAGRSSKAAPDHLPPWEKQLQRALRLAANNQFVLPRDAFFTKSQIVQIYGKKAAQEFSEYFKSVRRFDQDRANKVRQKQAMGLYQIPPASWPEKSLGFYTPEKYADWLIKHKCFGWMSILEQGRMQEVWLKYADQGKI